MIYMLAPAANLSFGVMPSGQTYVSDQNQMIFVANNSTADQTALAAFGCVTLTPLGGAAPTRVGTDADARTTGALPACTYANGTAGVGATLTGNVSAALVAQDGITLTVNQRLLVCNQAQLFQNGFYKLTQVGTVSLPFILTRDITFDNATEMSYALIKVAGGTLYAGVFFLLPLTQQSIVIGTTLLTFVRAS